MRGDEVVDALHKLLDAGKRAPPNRLVGDQREEALNLVQPRAVSRDEVHVPARPCAQPGLDLRMTVCGVVVADAVNVQLSRYGLVDLAQEGQELLVSVARLAGGQHGAVENVQGSKQRSRAVALVVVGDALDVAKPHGQHGLGAPLRLALTLLVHADHQGVFRRAQVQGDHIAQLLNEERVVGELEALRSMRLQPKQLEIPCDAGLGNAGLGSHCAHTPERGALGRLGVQRGLDQMRNAFVIDRAWFARAHVVVQASNAPIDKPRAPLTHSGLGQSQTLGDDIAEFAIGTAQENARPRTQGRRQGSTARKRLKLRAFIVRQQQFELRSSCSHGSISVSKIPQCQKLKGQDTSRQRDLVQPFAQGVMDILSEHVTVQIAKRSEWHTSKIMLKRWLVERSFAWQEKIRRLWNNPECLLNTNLQTLHLAVLTLLLRGS